MTVKEKQSGPKGKPKRIAAVICTYNRYDLLPLAIESCLKQTMDPTRFEIIVVDNSPDHTAAAAFGAQYEGHANLRYVVERTPGLSNARNVAAKMSDAEIIAYLDDDAIAKPTWLKALVQAFEAFGSAAKVAGGKISPIWDVPRPSWLGDGKLGYVSVVDWGGSARLIGEFEWIAGANIAFRREPLLEIGGFDTNLGRKGPETSLLSNEESAVVETLKADGSFALYVPEAEVDHLVDKRRLTHEWFRRRSAWQAVSDCMDDEKVQSWADKALDGTLNYLQKQPPRYRAISGLTQDVDDPTEFNDQLDAIYNMTVALLTGLKSPS